jgi:hypothetical protein
MSVTLIIAPLDELLADLAARDIRLSTPDGRGLAYDAPAGAISDELRAAIRANKLTLLALLAQVNRVEADLPLSATITLTSDEVERMRRERRPVRPVHVCAWGKGHFTFWRIHSGEARYVCAKCFPEMFRGPFAFPTQVPESPPRLTPTQAQEQPEEATETSVAPATGRTAEALAALDRDGLWIARRDDHGSDSVTHLDLDVLSQPEGATARRLVSLMEREGVTQLWLHPTWGEAAGLPARLFTDEETRDGIAHPFVTGEWGTNDSPAGTWGMQKVGRLRPWMKFYRRGQSGTIAVAVPYLDKRVRAWRMAPDAQTLLAAVLAYREAMRGYAYRSGPGASGTGLIRALHRGGTMLDLSASMTPADFPPPARARAEGKPELTPQLAWIRTLTVEESAAPYIHGYDKNAMFLAACSSLKVGFGRPDHLSASEQITATVEALTSTRKPIRRPVGYALARVAFDTMPEAVARGLLPHPCYVSPRENADPASAYRWYHTATLVLAGELGARLDVQEAYIWRETHEPLEPWYQRLRDARSTLMAQSEGQPSEAAPAIALAAIKATYTQGIGWLDPNWLRTSPEPEDLYRPDWRHAAIATANANLWRNLHKVYQDEGRAPFALLTDAAYFVSDSPDPLASAPRALRMGNGLGQFKVALAAFDTRKLAPAWELAAKGRDLGRVLGAFAQAISAPGEE